MRWKEDVAELSLVSAERGEQHRREETREERALP